jgi:uncharacterized delta-60 repeat protein
MGDIAVQSDGKIVAGGSSNSTFEVVRYNTNGSLDSTFGYLGKVSTDVNHVTSSINEILIQPNGKILAAGPISSKFQTIDFAAVRYNSDGTVDPSFGSTGKVTTDFVAAKDIRKIGDTNFSMNDRFESMALQSNGSFLLGGTRRASR